MIGIAVALWWAPCRDRDAAPIRIATFNIENFPKHAAQAAGAFDELARLDVSIVGVQEIVEPVLFDREARRRLGSDWRTALVRTSTHPRANHLGVLYDSRTWTHVATTVHDDTRLDGGYKPTVDVALRDDRGEVLHVLVVHLKAGGDGRAIRARQYAALARILERTPGKRIVVGDFNATDDRGDRSDLARLARSARLAWATEGLACTAFWDRDDGCFRSRLDHVLAWRAPTTVELGGACATHGCDREDRCPVYVERVSDHCPVVVALSSAR